MGKVLQCPRCRSKHPLDRHAGAASFPCSGCGRPLKVPEQLRTAAPSPPSGPARAEATRSVPAAAPPRRDATSVMPAATATPAPTGAVDRSRPRVIWRVVAWIAAVVLGGAIVLVGGRMLGYLSGQRALEVVITSGFRRYLVLLPLVPVWAVVTTVLVTLFLDGLPALARRRRARTLRARDRADLDDAGDADAVGAATTARPPVPDDPPLPQRVSEGRRAGGRRAGGHPG